MNHQKDIADLMKKLNWLRQNPVITEVQLLQVKEILQKLITALETV